MLPEYRLYLGKVLGYYSLPFLLFLTSYKPTVINLNIVWVSIILRKNTVLLPFTVFTLPYFYILTSQI